MALEGCASFMKYVMIVWNFIIMLLGIGILGIGVWMVVDKNSGKFVDDVLPEDSKFAINYSRVSDSNLYENLAYVLIAFGAIVLVIAFLGYMGAMKESQCLLGTCFVLLFLIFGALVGVGIYLYVKRDEIDVDEERLRPIIVQTLSEAVKNYPSDDASRDFMDAIQSKYQCCGAEHGMADYAPTLRLPSSCDISTAATPCVPVYYEHVREHIGIKQFFSGKFTVAMGVALGVAGGLILAMILTLYVCCSVRRSGSY